MKRGTTHVASVCLLLFTVACARTPTPDLEATVAARVVATEAERATSMAVAACTEAAQPTTSAIPRPTDTHTPSPSPEPSATPAQTATPTPPPTAAPTNSPTLTATPEPSATPTSAPPTETPSPTPPPQETRGLVANGYWVEGAPGPFVVGQDIWFGFDITNRSGETLDYDALGTWVEETGQFQKSWTYSSVAPDDSFRWRDHINIAEPGTYRLWLAVQFSDGAGALLSGPIVVTVE